MSGPAWAGGKATLASTPPAPWAASPLYHGFQRERGCYSSNPISCSTPIARQLQLEKLQQQMELEHPARHEPPVLLQSMAGLAKQQLEQIQQEQIQQQYLQQRHQLNMQARTQVQRAQQQTQQAQQLDMEKERYKEQQLELRAQQMQQLGMRAHFHHPNMYPSHPPMSSAPSMPLPVLSSMSPMQGQSMHAQLRGPQVAQPIPHSIDDSMCTLMPGQMPPSMPAVAQMSAAQLPASVLGLMPGSMHSLMPSSVQGPMGMMGAASYPTPSLAPPTMPIVAAQPAIPMLTPLGVSVPLGVNVAMAANASGSYSVDALMQDSLMQEAHQAARRRQPPLPPPAAAANIAERVPRKEWSPEEDEFIIKSVDDNGCRWRHIAASLPGRSDDAVRNRWNRLRGLPDFSGHQAHPVKGHSVHGTHHRKKKSAAPGLGWADSSYVQMDLSPEKIKPDRTSWKPKEDAIIAQSVAELGHRWYLIAERLPGRTDHAIRNRWHRLRTMQTDIAAMNFLDGSST